MSAFTPAGSGGATSSVVVTGATNPLIVNLALVTAATEYSYPLPANTKQYQIKLREGAATLQIADTAGQSGTLYITVPRYCFLMESDLSASTTLYMQASENSQIAEIRIWT